MIILKIEDNGPGIPEVDLPHVKEKFYKGKASQSHSGIGLSICEEIVRLHDGSIDVLSKLNEGTTVIVSLPLKGENK
jgi:signal transduction histidine kinase